MYGPVADRTAATSTQGQPSGSRKSRPATVWLAAAMLALPAAGCRSDPDAAADPDEPRSGAIEDEQRESEREGWVFPETTERQ
jgi:hypothetical protein